MFRTSDSVISFANRHTLHAFLLLYGVMALLILALMGSLYYEAQKEQMLASHRLAMQLQSESYIPRLRGWLSQDVGAQRVFPIDLAYNTAFFDAMGLRIEGRLERPLFNPKRVIELHEGYIHFTIALASYGVGEFYLVFETRDDGLWRIQALKAMAFYGVLLGLVLTLAGFGLSRLIFAPMRQAMELLDRFIKDTTHELGTPLQNIMGNIELIDPERLEPPLRKRFERIALSAQTIAAIYDDLIYLSLGRDLHPHKERIDAAQILRERCAYFQHRFEQKGLHVSLEAHEAVMLEANAHKLSRLIDNLISNAIKYNRQGGSIRLGIDHQSLHVSDSGEGMSRETRARMFERYARFSEREGGFGIGLDIVSTIASEYGWRLEVESRLGEGTAIGLFWGAH
ncbi:MAG: HAMP domain-containing histidine kinase [Campylobacterales bacterium]|nr:HAMP domain-containing histidine kinase [Campylobacterales bacterium]